MSQKLLIVTVGLPRSGKSTWARKIGLPIVSLDAIRLVLHGSGTPVVGQKMVEHMANFQVRCLFMAGHTQVILDDCNTKRDQRRKWYPKEKDLPWQVEFIEVPTTMDRCIGRADQDHIPVIRQMADEAEPLGDDELRYDAYLEVPKEVLDGLGLGG